MINSKQDILDGIKSRVIRLKYKIDKESKYRPDGSLKLERLNRELSVQEDAYKIISAGYKICSF